MPGARPPDFGDVIRGESQALRAARPTRTKPLDPVLAQFQPSPSFEETLRTRAERVRHRAPEDVVVVVPNYFKVAER